MLRLLLLIALLLPLTGRAASPLVEARTRVAIAADRDHRLPVRRLPAGGIDVVIFSDAQLPDLIRYFKKYAKANLINKTEAGKIKPDTPTVIVLNGSDKADCSAAQHLAQRLTNILAVVWLDAPARAAAKFSAPLITAADAGGLTQAAAAQALFGGFDVKGPDGTVIPRSRLGFATPADAGMAADLESRINTIVASNIGSLSFPGCQIVVARGGEVVIDKSYGYLTGKADGARVTDSTLYDVASLTKILATVPAVMKQFDAGTTDMQSRPARWIPSLRREGLSDLTVADFLYHRTGLPAGINTYKLVLDSVTNAERAAISKMKGKAAAKAARLRKLLAEAHLQPGLFSDQRSEQYYIPIGSRLYISDSTISLVDSAIYNAPLKPRKYLYSCLNFCILSDMVEATAECNLNRYLDQKVFAPIGAYTTCFRPTGQYPHSQIAPTCTDLLIRRELLRGYVHDELAACSGGVQGNAGLFTTALDAAKLCQTWLQGGSYGGVEVFSPATVQLFTTRADTASSRLPGFDMARRTRSWRATGVSDGTYGHTGFTGTCCWVDPERDLVFVFLCNKLYPGRDNNVFAAMNPRESILTTIIESIDNGKKENSAEEEEITGPAQP